MEKPLRLLVLLLLWNCCWKIPPSSKSVTGATENGRKPNPCCCCMAPPKNGGEKKDVLGASPSPPNPKGKLPCPFPEPTRSSEKKASNISCACRNPKVASRWK